jgi:soluble lytic murein transglycosylase-like protein
MPSADKSAHSKEALTSALTWLVFVERLWYHAFGRFDILAFSLWPRNSTVITEQMRKSFFIVVVIAASASIAPAQTPSSYQIDNFDLPNAVQIQTPKVESPKPSAAGKRLTTTRNFSYSPAPDALVHLTGQLMNPSLGGFTTGNSDIDNFIVESGKRNSVDPLLLYSIMHQESSFKPRAISYKGARGLMQLMPPTAIRFGVSNIWDPKQNIEGGARYMRFLLDMFSGDVRLALAGYNAGEGAVLKYGYQIPPYSETREYVRRIGARYSMIRDPQAAAHANMLSNGQLAAAQQKAPIPLNVYERSVFMARLPDGRLQLVSQ